MASLLTDSREANSVALMYVVPWYNDYRKKILGQIKGFRRLNIECWICTIIDKKFVLYQINQNDELLLIEAIEKEKYKGRFDKYLEHIVKNMKIDIFYFRRLGIRVYLYSHVLKEIKNKKAKIVYEIPTYPSQIPHSVIRALALFIERIYTKKVVYEYAECIPVFCRIKNYPINEKMVKMRNGVDAKKYISILKFPLLDIKTEKKLRFLAIAHTQYWHGFERLIKAIHEWDGELKLEFSIYGNYTEETYKLIQLVDKYNMQNKVSFYQEKDVDDFTEFVKQFNIGVGCLALHRQLENKEFIGLDTSIKNKEYCALGIPFIHSTEDESFNDDLDFHFRVSEDENPIELREVIKWFNDIVLKYNDRTSMWNYATENLSYDIFAKQVIQKLEKREKQKW